jgi:predicted ATP-grasp superfamily ATP-dependent carboligase
VALSPIAGPALPVRGRCGDPWFSPDAAFASAILYADDAVLVPAGLAWPAWTADRPRAGERIGPGEPVCTVFAELRGVDAREAGATPAERARSLALERAETLRATMRGCMQSSPP